MADYRVHLVFFRDHDEDLMPTVIEACDEYTWDAWGGMPDFYEEALKKDPARTREMTIVVPQEAVQKLFLAPTVVATIEDA